MANSEWNVPTVYLVNTQIFLFFYFSLPCAHLSISVPYNVSDCDYTTEAEHCCSKHQTTGQQPVMTINVQTEQHCCSKQMGIRSSVWLKQAF